MVINTVIDPAEAFVAAFRRRAPDAAATQPDWLTRGRRHAIDVFARMGLPTTRDEEWRFTSVRPIAETAFVPAADDRGSVAPAFLDTARLPGAAAELVFVNGRYAPALSTTALPAGVRAESLAAVLASRPGDLEGRVAEIAEFDRQPFTALNTAFWTDGAFVSVAPGAIIESPIHVLFVSTGRPSERDGGAVAVTHPRVLIMAGADSQASIVESYVSTGAGRYFTNAVTEVALGDHALVEHYTVQREDVASYHIATLHAAAASNATFRGHSIRLGGALVRNDLIATLAGEGAECTLNGLYFADGLRLVDNHTVIDHAKPHCSSREVYKGILAGRARGVFNGKIVVRPDAQKTDAKQTNKALLLSGDAQVNTKPQLEIFANDVKCTHGAAVGQIDDDALFYLRARGLPVEEARRMLIQAFAGEVLSRMPLDVLRTRTEAELLQQLAGSRGQP